MRKCPSELTKAIGKFKPEDKVTVTYKRDGKENKATVTLGKNRSSSSFGYITPGTELQGLNDMHFDFDDNSHFFGNLRPRLGIKAQDTEEGKGVKVLEVADESLAEKAGIKNDLQRMVQFVEKLNELDTEGVAPLLHMSENINVLREDEVKGSISSAEALKNAPFHDEQFFKVPKVIKK